jgi:hypothetical protein
MEFHPVNLTVTMNEAELKLIQGLLADVNTFLELRNIRLYMEQSTTLAGPLGDTIKIQLNALKRMMVEETAPRAIVDLRREVADWGEGPSMKLKAEMELKETLATLQMIDEA